MFTIIKVCNISTESLSVIPNNYVVFFCCGWTQVFPCDGWKFYFLFSIFCQNSRDGDWYMDTVFFFGTVQQYKFIQPFWSTVFYNRPGQICTSIPAEKCTIKYYNLNIRMIPLSWFREFYSITKTEG